MGYFMIRIRLNPNQRIIVAVSTALFFFFEMGWSNRYLNADGVCTAIIITGVINLWLYRTQKPDDPDETDVIEARWPG